MILLEKVIIGKGINHHNDLSTYIVFKWCSSESTCQSTTIINQSL